MAAPQVDLRLYVLVDPERAGGHGLPELAWHVAAGGATLVQLRDKHSSTRAMIEEARAIRENLVAMANELFDVVKSGAVKIEVHQTYPLKDAAKAHADLAARKTTGSTVLTV